MVVTLPHYTQLSDVYSPDLRTKTTRYFLFPSCLSNPFQKEKKKRKISKKTSGFGNIGIGDLQSVMQRWRSLYHATQIVFMKLTPEPGDKGYKREPLKPLFLDSFRAKSRLLYKNTIYVTGLACIFIQHTLKCSLFCGPAFWINSCRQLSHYKLLCLPTILKFKQFCF